MMTNPDVDRFKVWPTRSDQYQFTNVIISGSREEVEKRFPITKRKYARYRNPRPRMVEAYLFFSNSIREFFEGASGDPPIASDVPLATRIEECLQALKNSLLVVAIDLQKDDDAQVIFETLNARGEPLLPADLLRNFIFLRAARKNEPQEELYEKYWKGFDEQFWRQEVKQGRLLRPRSDLFMQHFLTLQQLVDIPVKHLFVEYKFWIEKKKPFGSVQEELAAIARLGNYFRRIMEPKEGDIIEPIAKLLDVFDVRTAYPLILYLLDAEMSENEYLAVSSIIESYLVRRGYCGLTTQNYNRVFIGAIKHLSQNGKTSSELRNYFQGLRGESAEWPSDSAFAEAWKTKHAYQALNNPKIVHILRRLDDSYFTSKTEAIQVKSALTVEHILPQNWVEYWPLAGGERGLNQAELWIVAPDDPRAVATRRRNAALQTIGNLTVVTQPLNSAASNAAWQIKKAELNASILPINKRLQERVEWNETEIENRSNELFSRALTIWSRPQPMKTVQAA